MKLGVDVGGTHTDAVIICGQRILATHKAATSADVTLGVQQAMQQVLEQAAIDRNALHSVVIGTTSFTNAVVERRHLSRTAAVRIGMPAGVAVPPFSAWPEDIREVLGGRFYGLHGGHEYDGQQTQPLREAELVALVAALRTDEIQAVAISAPFSTVNGEAEQQVAAYLREHLPALDITTSCELGRLGLLERENA
ncbi:MAG: hydantoinase/oxoprolinase N-terminal domain-containing protein, partial [Pseudomonas sp.]